MSDYSDLKKSAEAIEPGKYMAPQPYEEDRYYFDDELKTLEYMANAGPQVILALIAENERHESERGSDKCMASSANFLKEKARAERDSLKAENDAMRQFLRELHREFSNAADKCDEYISATTANKGLSIVFREQCKGIEMVLANES